MQSLSLSLSLSLGEMDLSNLRKSVRKYYCEVSYVEKEISMIATPLPLFFGSEDFHIPLDSRSRTSRRRTSEILVKHKAGIYS